MLEENFNYEFNIKNCFVNIFDYDMLENFE